MAISRAGGDPDSTRDDVVDVVDPVDEFGAADDAEDDLDVHWHDEPDADADATGAELSDRFNAFDSSTWDIGPAPVPWYETKQAMSAAVAASVALVVLVVSVVLLAVRGSSSSEEPALVQSPSVASSPTPTAPLATAVVTPPPVPPPPVAPPPVVSPAPPAYVPVNRPSAKPERQPSQTVRLAPTSFAPRPVVPPSPGR